MENLLTACRTLAEQGEIKEVSPGVYFVGTVDVSSPEFQEFKQTYAEAFEKRRQKREAEERKAAAKYQREGPWFF